MVNIYKCNLICRCVLLVCFIAAMTQPTVVLAVDVVFADANFEAKVRDELGIPVPTVITNVDMEALVTEFSASYSGIVNIQGIEYAINLTELRLIENQISDLNALSGLTGLNSLHLHFNQISDISALSGLTNLKELHLHYNKISDVSVLFSLTDLTYLGLSNNQIVGIDALSGLASLKDLNLRNNQISDVSTLSSLTSLTDVSLNGNQISDISALSGLGTLNSLRLYDNQISDVSALSDLSNLTYLDLGNNQIQTINFSGSDLANLIFFDIGNNPLTSVLLADAVLSQSTFDNLMDGGSSNYVGITGLDYVSNLDMSGVDFSEISDLSLMYAMADLEKLLLENAINLDGSQVVTITGELDSLSWLDVTGLWESFDIETRESLNSWDAVPGNTLIKSLCLEGDVNCDGEVGLLDLNILGENWKQTGRFRADGDLNGDGGVGLLDLDILGSTWGNTATPEPGTAAILTMGLICLGRPPWR